MDAKTIGQRIAQARTRAGMTQAQLAAMVPLDRSALTKIEVGDRRVSALELARLAETLDVRIEWFVQDEPAAIVSRRNAQAPGEPSPAVDRTIGRLAHAVEFVREHDGQFSLPAVTAYAMPVTQAQTESLAETARGLIGVDRRGPLTQLTEKLAARGLMAFSLNLGTSADAADAATILLARGGVAVVNGGRQVGRRRVALAHEFGHYLVADEYTVDWRVAADQDTEQREKLLDRFARALLLPEMSLREEWAARTSGEDGDLRTAAVRIASAYRVDMSTLARRLAELHILGRSDAASVRSVRTTQADIVELNLVVSDELAPPTLPRDYQLAVLRLYRSETISAARALDLLLDTWDEDNLPELPRRAEDSIWQYV